jgi:hypothetical protein
MALSLTMCKQKEELKNPISYRDSAVKLYLERNGYLNKNDFQFFDRDSNSFDYKLLKGYYFNDSSYLMGVIRQLNEPYSYGSSQYLDSFWKLNIPIVKYIKAKECYQFQYSEAFCREVYIITISKDSSSIKLNSIIFKPTKMVDNKLAGYEIIENKNKYLKLSDWDTLIDKLDYADFWNLKPANYDAVLDPSKLTIIGIKDNPYTIGEERKINSVSRTIFKNTAIYQAFLVARRLAQIVKVCGD